MPVRRKPTVPEKVANVIAWVVLALAAKKIGDKIGEKILAAEKDRARQNG